MVFAEGQSAPLKAWGLPPETLPAEKYTQPQAGAVSAPVSQKSAEAREAIDHLSATLKHDREVYRQQDKTIHDQKELINELEEQLRQAVQFVEGKAKEEADLKAENQRMTDELRRLNEERQQLSQQSEDTHAERATFQSTIEHLRKENEEKTSRIDKLKDTLKTVRRQLGFKEETVRSLQHYLEERTKKSEQFSQTHEAKMKRLKDSNMKLGLEIKDLKEKLEMRPESDQIKDLMAQLSAETSAKASMQERLDKEAEARSQMESRLKELEHRNHVMATMGIQPAPEGVSPHPVNFKKEMQDKIRSLQSDKLALKERVRALEAEVDRLGETVQAKDEEKSRLVTALQKDNAQLRVEKAAKEQKWKQWKEEHLSRVDLTTKMESLTQAHAQVSKRMQGASSRSSPRRSAEKTQLKAKMVEARPGVQLKNETSTLSFASGGMPGADVTSGLFGDDSIVSAVNASGP